ncbi:hypothetical protein ACIQAC_01340 [Streptomyces sp. NPDC088387]|uniref:hypothetical protein n=1 Tax=Streptomyces sp. NPDC088387 TaxID=3365859 RepID=UPI0037F840FA
MSAQPSPDGDELRARAYLRALRARPFGHQEPPMPPPEKRPITPTRVIPASTPLPARPPEPGESPPWHIPPPPPPPAAAPPPPAPIEVRHVHEVLLVIPDPEPEPAPWWARLWDRLATWRMAVALLAALVPWAGGQSPVGIWSRTVHQARTEAGIGAAYVIAGVAIAATWALDRHTGRALPRFLLVTALLGAFGVLSWWDPFALLTGVHR